MAIAQGRCISDWQKDKGPRFQVVLSQWTTCFSVCIDRVLGNFVWQPEGIALHQLKN